MTTRPLCSKCGTRKATAYNSRCSRCIQADIDRAHEETRKVVATGKCPQCGSPLRRNNSLAGWWECSQRGDGHFRKDPSKPACSWQGFTE